MEIMDERINQILDGKEKLLIERLNQMKVDMILDLKQTEQKHIQEITSRMRSLDLYLNQLNEYQASELTSMREDHNKF